MKLRLNVRRGPTCGQLEGHTGGRPDVCRGSISRPQEDLQGPVLPGLDVLGVVMVHPAGVTQVGDLALQHRLLSPPLGSQSALKVRLSQLIGLSVGGTLGSVLLEVHYKCDFLMNQKCT